MFFDEDQVKSRSFVLDAMVGKIKNPDPSWRKLRIHLRLKVPESHAF